METIKCKNQFCCYNCAGKCLLHHLSLDTWGVCEKRVGLLFREEELQNKRREMAGRADGFASLE